MQRNAGHNRRAEKPLQFGKSKAQDAIAPGLHLLRRGPSSVEGGESQRQEGLLLYLVGLG